MTRETSNTGLVDLRPAGRPVPVLIYYTNRALYSKDFPQMGEGRMAAMVGPTYRYQEGPSSTVRFTAFLDDRLFFWDHERETFRVGQISPEGAVVKMDRIFANVPWRGITDMKFGSDGALYVIEYGHGFYQPNTEAFDLEGRRIWSRSIDAAGNTGEGLGAEGRRAFIPAKVIASKGLVLIRFL